MTSRVVIFLSGAVLALGACGKQNAASNGAASGNAGDTSMPADNATLSNNGAAANDSGPNAPLTSQAFTNAAAASDRFEIESSNLAAASASSAAVKKFAAQMINAHTQSTAKLKSTAAALSPAVIPDNTLTADQQQKLESLKGLKGAAFDAAYSSAQVDAHQMTLDALRSYAASGDNAQLKTFASSMVPTVAAHLNMAKALR